MRILVLWVCTAALAQQPPAFQSESKVVLIDAVVTGKKGEFIRDLTAKDFHVWEDNKEQTLASFSVAPNSAPAEPRRLVLFFDDIGMSLPEQAGARQAAARFIDAVSAPDQLMAVVTFDGTAHVAGSFSADPGRLKDFLRAARLNTPNTEAQSQASAAARALVPAVANMAQNLDAAPGRKIIVLLTGRRSLAAPRSADVANLIQFANRSNVAVYPVIQGGALPAASATGADADQQGQVASHRNVPVARPYSARGDDDDVPVTAQADDSIVRTIARGTGGVVLADSNDLAGQLQRIAAEQHQYYVLSYTPPESRDGACHTLRIKVDRRGADVRARSGYCTEKSQDVLAQTPVEKDLEKRAAAAQSGPTGGSIQTPYFYIAGNLARVHAAMDIPTAALKFENQKGKLHAEMNILGLATSADGTVAARFSDIVRRTFDNKDELDKSNAKPLHYAKEFKIVPGDYTLTVVFSSSGGESFGKFTAPLNIPPFDAGRLTISAIAFSTAVKPATDIGLEASLIDEGTPLIAGGETVIPSGSSKLVKSSPAYCYFEIYTPGANEPAAIHLRILDAKTGTSKWEGNASTARIHQQPNGQTTIPVGMSLPIDALGGGPYKLEVTATGGPDKTAIRTADFEIATSNSQLPR
jgi:VWFA-related protein